MKDVKTHVSEDVDGFILKNVQEIPQEYLDELCDYRKAQTKMSRTREYHRVAAIPTIFVVKWLQEGFDVFREPVKAVVRRLKQEGLDAFLTTEKSV